MPYTSLLLGIAKALFQQKILRNSAKGLKKSFVSLTKWNANNATQPIAYRLNIPATVDGRC